MSALIALNFLSAFLKGWQVKAVIAAGAIALLTFAYVHVEGKGYDRAKAHYEAEIAAQTQANQIAIERAKTELEAALDALQLRTQELKHVLQDIDAEAAADPDADGLGIGLDSVRRLNRVR